MTVEEYVKTLKVGDAFKLTYGTRTFHSVVGQRVLGFDPAVARVCGVYAYPFSSIIVPESPKAIPGERYRDDYGSLGIGLNDGRIYTFSLGMAVNFDPAGWILA